ncbi:MAG: hypothetical protein IJ600_07425 [Lachnospiraceae bacterium]|nr:hypothetical protein [Lachnospiraceae bacterium]
MAKESTRESIRPSRLHGYGDERLDKAIAELEKIDAGHHRDSGKFNRVMEAIDHLHEISSPFYTKPVDEDHLAAIKGAYTSLLEACDAYLEGKGEKRRSEYGTQRLNCIRAIRDITQMDAAILNPDHPAYDPSMNLVDLLAEARSTTVSIPEGEKFQPVGDVMSIRVPLEVEDSHGTQKGFFTADRINVDDHGLLVELEERFRGQPAMAPLCEAMKHGEESHVLDAIKNLQFKEEKEEVTGGSRFRGFVDRLRKKKHKERQVAEDFCGSMMVAYDKKRYGLPKEFSDPEAFYKWVDSDPSILPTLQALSQEVRIRVKTYETNMNSASIQANTEIASRNIGMSRFAEALGCGHLIAKAERMTIQSGEMIQTGVFMHTAEGSDVSHLRPSDPLVSLFYHQGAGMEAMESGAFKRSLANLQVLDYICGNVDRHMRNMIYQVGTDSEGRLQLQGVIGIDNDMSLGEILDDKPTQNERELKVDQFSIIPRETAELIMQMDQPFVEHQLSDLGLAPKEIDAACKRIGALQRRLMDPQQVFYYDSNTMPGFQLPYAKGKLLIVDDELDFQRIPYQEMVKPGNLFDRGRAIPGMVKGAAEKMYNDCWEEARKAETDMGKAYGSEQKKADTRETVSETVQEAFQKFVNALDKVPPIYYAKAKIQGSIAAHKNRTETHTGKKIELKTLEEMTPESDRKRTKSEGAEMRRQRRMSQASVKQIPDLAMATRK